MATLDSSDPEQDRTDLVTWLQAYDLQGLHSTLVDFGYDKLSVCTLLDDTTLEEMGIQSRVQKETLLTAVNDLRQLDADVDEYDDGWSSQEEEVATEPTADVANGEEAGAMASTMRFLSGLDSGTLEKSYRESFVEPDEEAPAETDDFPLPPPPPPMSIPADHQYAEIPVPPPPPPAAGGGAGNGGDVEEKTTSSFLASLGSSMGSFLGGDTFDDSDGPPLAPKPRATPRSPKPSARDDSIEPPLPSDKRPVERQDSKPEAAPRKPKPPPPARDTSSMQTSDAPAKPATAPKSSLSPPAVSAPFDVYASVTKSAEPVPGIDLPPVKSAGPPPAAKAKPPTTKPKSKGVSIVEPEKSVKRSPSDSKIKDPKDRRSMVDIQGGDVDLDALLADLLEMENMAATGISGSPVKSSTMSRPPPSQRAAPAPLGEDEFTRLMAEMDMMSSSTLPLPSTDLTASRQSSDLSKEINKLSGGGKVISPVPADEMATSAIAASLLGSDSNQFEPAAPSSDVEDDLEALSRDMGVAIPAGPTSSRLSGSFVSSMFGSAGSEGRRPSDEDNRSPDEGRRQSDSLPRPGQNSMVRQSSNDTFRRPSQTPSLGGYNDVEVREVRNTDIVKLPERQQDRLQRELEHMNNGNAGNLSAADKEARLKALKVQMAVEKLKEAKVKKVVLKAYNDDGSSKMIVIDDKMTAREVCSRLMKKNRVQPGPNFLLVEQLTEHYIERRLEDHDLVVPVLDSWPRESNNSIAFTNKPDKYMLLKRPQLFMPPNHAYAPGQKTGVMESMKRDIILKELFVQQTLPDIEGFLTFKEGRKGNWKKLYFSLRKSGLYYSHKGKAAAMKDLHRLVELKDMDVYTGHAYRKRYRAHTEFCFSLKPAGPLDIMERKMRHFCADTRQEQNAWIQGIRLAKMGNQVLVDYELTYKQMPWLSRETEEEIDGIVRLQQETTDDDDKRDRSGTLGKRLRLGTVKKPHDHHAAQDLAARSELASSSGSPIGSRPMSSASMDEQDGELTSWQKQFGQAWKSAADEDENGGMKINLDDLPPTPKTTATPYTSEFAPGEEDGMYNVRLF